MIERQLHPHYPEMDHGIRRDSEPVLARLALVSDARETTPTPTDTPPAEREVPIYGSNYSRDDLARYTISLDTQKSIPRKNRIDKAERANTELQHELFFPSKLRIPSKPFVLLLESWDIAVGHNIDPHDQQYLALPVDILLKALTQMVPEEKNDAEKKLLLRKNFLQVRLEAYKLLVGYCKAALEQSKERE